MERKEAFKIENVENALSTNNINKDYLAELINECQMTNVLTPDDIIEGTKDVLKDLSEKSKQDLLDRIFDLRKDEIEEDQMDIEHVLLHLGISWDYM